MNRSRWIATAVVPAAIAAGALTWSLQPGAAADLPAKTPEEVLAMALDSDVRAYSGALEQSSQLGLPELPDTGPAAGLASALDLVTGTHTARVFVDGPANVRLQVLDRLAERDVVRRNRDVWLYNSRDNTAAHVTLPVRSPSGNRLPEDFGTPDGMQTPDQLAHRLLAAVEPSTQVTVGEDAEVAGRTAYELVLDPLSTDTLVDSVSVAVDSQTGLPLSIKVQARGQQQPAFSLAFTELRLQAPAQELFEFTPPPGAKVQEHTLQVPSTRHEQGDTGHLRHGPDSKPTVSGEAWDAVVELPAGSVPADSQLLDQLTYPVSGGRALSTALLTVLFTDDGRVFAGSVPLGRLQAAAGER
ncbi:outer membrane lipoprotein carrier protein LolA [Arthrobacter sp. GCM10027362]|uniref:LolA family protein n=1 Tax=Arthrobacter sp. GCM10027362 TaxID=3273379 RepID=UPI003643698C